MSPRLRLALLAGSALILVLELPALGALLHHDLFGPRPTLASAHAFAGGRRAGDVTALAAVGSSDGTHATGALDDDHQEPR